MKLHGHLFGLMAAYVAAQNILGVADTDIYADKNVDLGEPGRDLT